MLERILNNTRILEKAMDIAWLRNEAIAQNIANVDTPGYKRKDVSFGEYLSQAVEKGSFKGLKTDRRHMDIGDGSSYEPEIRITEDNSLTSMRLDGNNVDIENEMALMAKNTIQYNVLAQRLSIGLRSLKSVINEGRR